MTEQIINNEDKREPLTSNEKKMYQKPAIVSEYDLEVHAGSPLSEPINPLDEFFK
jgi:hypothetical protein